jgi:aminoglycoside phosphotransferase (APT) family kinase protein
VHGDDLTAAERALLRSAPPAAALAWAAAAAGGDGAEIAAVRALEGGTSSAVHALDVVDRAGRSHALVLRRFVRPEWLAEEPDAALREAAALDLAAGGDLPVPRLVALDPRGAAIGDGRPAVLTTRQPGRVVWEPSAAALGDAAVGDRRAPSPASLGDTDDAPPPLDRRRDRRGDDNTQPALDRRRDRRGGDNTLTPLDRRRDRRGGDDALTPLDRWLDGLAAALVAIHATPADDAPATIGSYDDWGLLIDRPPASSRLPTASWERAFALFERPVPAGRRFVHRDFHPGNVLWSDGAVSAVVDWACASLGEPDADVGYCRENLARAHSVAVADRFLARHRVLAGDRPLDPAWDVRAALGGHDADDLADWWSAREDAFLAQAVARS